MNKTGNSTVTHNLYTLSEVLFYLLLLFTPFAYGTVETWSLSVSHLLVYAVFIPFIIGKVLSDESSVFIPEVLVLLLVLMAWALISSIWITVYRCASATALLKILDYSLVIFYIHNHFRHTERRKRLLFIILGVGSLVAGYGLIRYYLEQGTVGASAPFVNHNHFAGYLEMSLAVGLGVFARSARKYHPEASLLSGLIVLLVTLGLIFSLSRGGILSFMAVCVCFSLPVLFRKRFRAVLMPLVFLFSILLGYLLILETETVENRLATLGDTQTVLTMSGRVSAWESSLRAIGEKPFSGYGPGTFATVFPRFRRPGCPGRFYYAHNDFLQIWVEYGIVGVIIILVGIVIVLKNIWYIFRNGNRRKDYLSLGISAGILSILFHSIVDFNLNLHANALLFIVLISLLTNRKSIQKPPGTGKVSAVYTGVLGLLLICLGLWHTVPRLKADIIVRKGESLAEDNFLETIELYRTVHHLVPGNAEYSFRLGYAYFQSARTSGVTYFYSEAEKCFNTSLGLNPMDSEVWLAKAFVSAELGNNRQAGDSFRNAVANDPNNPACRFYLSDYYLTVGKLELAVASSRKGIELSPAFLGQRIKRFWEFTQETALLQKLIPDSFFSGHFHLAKHLYNKKRYMESIEQLGLCNDKVKRDYPLYQLMGRNLLALNQPDSAEYYFRTGIEKHPHEMRSYRLLSRLLYHQGRFEEAERIFSDVLNRDNDVNVPKASVYYEYALYFGLKKDFRSQQYQIRKALKSQMNNITYLELLADSYLGEKRFYEALRTLQRAEIINSGNISTLRKIAGIYNRLGRGDLAAEYWRKILVISPGNNYAQRMLEQCTRSGGGPDSTNGK